MTDLEVSAEIKERILRVNSKIRIHKVVVTCSKKFSNGDFFAGFNAGWVTNMDESMQDLDSTIEGVPSNVMTIKEAQDAAMVLAHYVEVAAIENAVMAGAITEQKADESIQNSRLALRDRMEKKIRVRTP